MALTCVLDPLDPMPDNTEDVSESEEHHRHAGRPRLRPSTSGGTPSRKPKRKKQPRRLIEKSHRRNL